MRKKNICESMLMIIGTILYMLLFPMLGGFLKAHVFDSQQLSNLYLSWTLLYDPILGCGIAVLCGVIWNAPLSRLLLGTELVCIGYVVFSLYALAGGYSWLNAISPSPFLRLFYLGILATLLCRTLFQAALWKRGAAVPKPEPADENR